MAADVSGKINNQKEKLLATKEPSWDILLRSLCYLKKKDHTRKYFLVVSASTVMLPKAIIFYLRKPANLKFSTKTAMW